MALPRQEVVHLFQQKPNTEICVYLRGAALALADKNPFSMDERQSLIPIHSPLRIESQTLKAAKLGGEERMHALTHVDALAGQLLQRIRHRSHFHRAKIRN
jgi:hypothetical protein